MGEALVGTRIYVGYVDGTSEVFDVTLSMAEAKEKYHGLLTGEGTEDFCACGTMICFETPFKTSYRLREDIDEIDLTRHTLVDTAKTRARRRPARKPASKRTTTAPKGQTKKA